MNNNEEEDVNDNKEVNANDNKEEDVNDNEDGRKWRRGKILTY